VLLLLVAAFVAVSAWPALREIGARRFLTDRAWHPTEGAFGLAPMLVASALVTAGAVALASPVGIGSAVFQRFYAPARLARLHRRGVEILAGIPSVVLGIFGLTVVVPSIAAARPPGPSLLAGCLVLAVMIAPTIALAAETALASVPRAWTDGARALGLRPWAVARRIALPAALPGIATGVFLAVARAVGETMVVVMVCGNVVQIPRTPFDPVRPLPANIALEMGYATGTHRSALFASGLALMLAVALALAVAEVAVRRRRRV